MPFDRSWLPLSENPNQHPKKKKTKKKPEPFSQEMHLKIPLSSRGLRLSNSKPGCRVSALCLFVKEIPPMAFWHRAQSDKCFFQLLIPELTPVSLLESKSGFEIFTQLADTKATIFKAAVYGYDWRFQNYSKSARQWARRESTRLCFSQEFHEFLVLPL